MIQKYKLCSKFLFEIFRIISKKRFELFEVFEKINSPDMVFLTTDLAQTKLPILKSSWRKTINCDQSWTRDELIGGGAVQCSVTLWLHWTINIETFPNLFFHEAPCIQLRNYMGCLMEFYTSLTLFYSKMSFKILKFSNRPSFFFPSNLLDIALRARGKYGGHVSKTIESFFFWNFF
jgi:hypothetical protein